MSTNVKIQFDDRSTRSMRKEEKKTVIKISRSRQMISYRIEFRRQQ